MNRILISIFLLMSCIAAQAQLSQKEQLELVQTVKANYELTGIEGSNIYSTSSGYRVYVSVIQASNTDEAEIKARRLATEFFIGAENQSISVLESHSGLTSNEESLSDKILQTSKGQVKNMQALCRMQDPYGEPVYAYYLVISKTNASPQIAGLMSMIVPGAGQFYKGNVGKGSIFLSLTVAAGAGIIVCESTRSSYIDKSNNVKKNINLYDTDKANAVLKEYSNNASKWETYRNLSIGAASAIYLWNVIDAYFTRGAQRPVVTAKSGGSLAIVPQLTFDNMGFGLAYTF